MNAKPIIYLVEDSEIIAQAIKRAILLERSEAEVHCFESGEEMIDVFRTTRPHLIFLDYFLDANDKSRMKGNQIVDHLKTTSDFDRIIIISGTSHKETLETIKELPVAGFIHKGEEEILEKVQEFITKLC